MLSSNSRILEYVIKNSATKTKITLSKRQFRRNHPFVCLEAGHKFIRCSFFLSTKKEQSGYQRKMSAPVCVCTRHKNTILNKLN